jgi:hypothetical protein
VPKQPEELVDGGLPPLVPIRRLNVHGTEAPASR